MGLSDRNSPDVVVAPELPHGSLLAQAVGER